MKIEKHIFKALPERLAEDVFRYASAKVFFRGEKACAKVEGLPSGFMWDGSKWILDFVSTSSLAHGSLSVYYRKKKGSGRMRFSDHWSGRDGAGNFRGSCDMLDGDAVPVMFQNMPIMGGVEC